MGEVCISTEEFQRFQTQLLDLREAQICATDAKLRAESRLKDVEGELFRIQQVFKESNASSLNELKHENKLLRDKLLSTESSFQLQSSTLRAEYQRLYKEFEHLKISTTQQNTDSFASFPKSMVNQNIQTNCTEFVKHCPQMVSNYTLNEIGQLENSVQVANESYDLLIETVELMQDRIEKLETCYTKLLDYETKLRESTNEIVALRSQLDNVENALNGSRLIERDLRNQVENVKRRSEKLNRELRRQLGRFLRGSDVDSVQGLSKTSLHSSSSSLASIMNGANSSTSTTLSTNNASLSSEGSCFDLPPGFFSMADFKAVIDRMSEVQDENCYLRNQNQRLNQDLMMKSQLIQSQLNQHLTKQFQSHSQPNYRSTDQIMSTSWFPFFKSSSGMINGGFVSGINMQTINSLKLMCEDLLTKNLKLTEQLKMYETKEI